MAQHMVITGASSGVGRRTAIMFSNLGWRVTGLARREEKLKILGDALPNFHGIVSDITDYGHMNWLFSNVIRDVDVLVNNAGIYMKKPLDQYTGSEIYKIISTNLLGTIYVTKAALSQLKRNARIINISSIAALHGIKDETIYCASKGGLDGFFESLSLERDDLKITTIYPAGINTELWNENNVYPGDVNDLLTAQDVVDEISDIVSLRNNVIKKKVIICPASENQK